MYDDNLPAEGTIYVPVRGLRSTKQLALETVSEMLTLWHERQPAQFGAYLAEVVTGAKPKAARN